MIGKKREESLADLKLKKEVLEFQEKALESKKKMGFETALLEEEVLEYRKKILKMKGKMIKTSDSNLTVPYDLK